MPLQPETEFRKLGAMSEWSERIKELEALDMTLAQIAKAIGMHVSSVSDIKRGASKAPTGMAAVELYKLHRRKCKPRKRSASQ